MRQWIITYKQGNETHYKSVWAYDVEFGKKQGEYLADGVTGKVNGIIRVIMPIA